MPQRFAGDASPLAMKILNYILPAFSFWLTAVGLEVNWPYVALAFGSSVAGSLFLSYYRPEKTFGRMISKMALSSVAGLIFGTAVVTWRDVEAPAYAAAIYCLVALLALIFLKSVVGFGESNSDSLTRVVLQRVFNIPVKSSDVADGDGRHRGGKKKGVTVTHGDDDGQPVVVIDKSARPDEVRVIEQTEVNKKDGTK